MIQPALVDTDTLSAIMRSNPIAAAHASDYLRAYNRFTISLMTRYEILRGLHAKSAVTQLAAFEHFCATNEVLQLTDDVIKRAAAIYGDLHRRGSLIGDADILIAPTALGHGLDVVTNNTSHFARISGLRLQNWLSP